MDSRMELGKIVNTFGLKGEVKVYSYVDYLNKVKTIYIKGKKAEVERARIQKNVLIMKIKGIDTVEEAEELRNVVIEMEREDAPELPKGTYYIRDLLGFSVYTEEGELLGKLDDVFQTGANDVYKVENILLPAIKDVIKQIDTENKKIIVHLLDGLV